MLFNSPEGVYRAGAAAALLLPAAWTIAFRALVMRFGQSDQATAWLVYRQRAHVLSLLAVPAWWSFWDIRVGSWTISNCPAWILFLAPLCIGDLIARFLALPFDRKLLDCKWTMPDVVRLAIWGALASTLPLLLLAYGMDTIIRGSEWGICCLPVAGAIALFGTISHRRAAGIRPRRVKSGELYKRALTLAKRVNVHLESVSVVPFGRGRLTNAFGGLGTVAITDDYGHWANGAELDFVIGHELAHVKHKHGLKKLPALAGGYATAAAVTFTLPPLRLSGRLIFDFGAILLPLWAFYFSSRRFEYEADHLGCELVGDRAVAIRALETLCQRREMPVACNSFEELFLTHPPLRQRIAALASVRTRTDNGH